jgi:glycosyltransferase involved in cell wall biosynthesis
VVGISLITLVPGVFGGTETYARELVRALARVGTLEYRVFTPELAEDAADGLPGVRVRSYRASRTMPGRLLAMGLATASPRLRRELRLDELEALHFPLSIMMPPVRQPPAVTTVHDVLDKLYPEVFSRGERAYRRVVYGWTARLSRLIIVPSEHSKEVFVERAGLDPARIRVIPLGVSQERYQPGTGEREPFLLYPADNWPHKNHARLLEAFARVRQARPELRLVLVGARLEGVPAAPGVEVRGYISPDELAALYRTATALVFPSLHETFGLPPLEAMACGCPVAVSRAGSLPEICGEAARYFDPRSVDEIVEAILGVVDQPGELVAKGLEQAKRYTWDECARRHEDVYRELSKL